MGLTLHFRSQPFVQMFILRYLVEASFFKVYMCSQV